MSHSFEGASHFVQCAPAANENDFRTLAIAQENGVARTWDMLQDLGFQFG